jgi:hypothetical protein
MNMAIATTNGQVLQAFSKMRIKHPLLVKAHQLFDDLREAKRSSLGRPQKFGALFASSQSGKSMSVQIYIETHVVDEVIARGLFPADMDRAEIARQQKLVLHVTLSAKASMKGLAADILAAFGDPASPRGTTQTLFKRVYDYIRHHGTELIIIDEIQHVADSFTKLDNQPWIGRSGLVHSTAVTDTLKTFLLQGLVPLMFIGIQEARHHIFNDIQLASRCYKELDFTALDLAINDEKSTFFDYIGRLGLKLQQHGLFEESTNLLIGDIPAHLHAAAGGRLGMATNIILAAAIVAREENATSVMRAHIAQAIDDWAIPLNIIDYNPFRAGLRTLDVRSAA